MRCASNVAKWFLLTAVSTFGNNLLSQEFELITVKTAYYPAQEIADPRSDGEVGIREWGIELAFPHALRKDRKSFLIHKLAYGSLSVDFEAGTAPSAIETSERYQSISYNVGLIQTVGAHWRAVVNGQPTLASDFEEKLNGDDFIFQASALLVNVKNDKLNYGFGLAYTTRVGRQRILPVCLLNYSADRISLEFVFPNTLTFMVKTPKNVLSYGLRAGLDGGVFNNTADIATLGTTIDKVGYSRVLLAPAITVRPIQMLKITLQGGVAVGRRLEFIDDQSEIIDKAPQNAPFVGMSVSLTPEAKKSEAVKFN